MTSPRIGRVTGTAPLMVRFDGDTSAVGGLLRFEHYTPAVGHTVVLVKAGPHWLVMGRVVPG